MTPTELIALISAIIGPLLAGVAVVWGAQIGRKAGQQQAAATLESARVEAAAAVKTASEEAATETRRAVTADWEAYSRAMLEDRKMLADRLEAVEMRAQSAERRIDTAETRAVIAEERATRWESLYRIAVHHMRELITWASDISHMGNMPQAPAELQSDL